MQTTGYLLIGYVKILVLVQSTNYAKRLKKRTTGKDGQHLKDESEFLSLSENYMYIQALHDGKTISI